MIGWPTQILAVAIGGALGALSRYGLTVLCTQTSVSRGISGLSALVGGGPSFATTLANLIGCLLLGIVYQWSESVAAMAQTPLNPKLLLAIRVGFLGSLTTFSTLIGDCAVLGNEGRTGVSLTLLSVNLIAGWGLFLLAIWVVRGVMS
ncbi:fluoride efflux transporter FluC [Neorhodopirellula pilleata]|uniref:Fluoride-specific ion channel FluC n=1 Tax=Neorhodopirellula pilleata TaxID=2714738 RepID=A0A5C6AVT1_9BACT|nr:CrcB family protein [Neorhodopirellula pilleata]TWU03162.1 putative fluoride ion transporter CrcB [Neorhodopirellula pilleata]